MQLRTRVKVGNITNLSDARYCAGMGVDLLGFSIGSNDKQVSLEVFLEIANWVAGPKFVFECTDSVDDELLEKVTQLPAIHHVQLTYAQLLQYQKGLANKGAILEIKSSDWLLVQHELKVLPVTYLLLKDDNFPDWEAIKEINKEFPVLIHYSSIPNDVDIDHLPIAGIVLAGSEEDRPGQKDYDHLSTVLESLEVIN